MGREDDDDDNEEKEDKEDSEDEDGTVGGIKKSSVEKPFKKKTIKTLQLKYLITLKDKNLKIYNYLTRSKLFGSRFQPKIKFSYKPSKTVFGDLSLIPYNTKGSWLQLNSTYQLTKQFKIKGSINNNKVAKANFTYKNSIKEQNITLKANLNLEMNKQFSHTWSMQILKKIYWKQEKEIFSKLVSDASLKFSNWKPEITLKTGGQLKQTKNKMFMELKSGIQKNNLEGSLKSQLQIFNSTSIFGLTIKTINKDGKIPIDFKYICKYFNTWSFGMNVKENLDYLFFVDKKFKGTNYAVTLDKNHLSTSIQKKTKSVNFMFVTGIQYPKWKFNGFAIKLQYNT